MGARTIDFTLTSEPVVQMDKIEFIPRNDFDSSMYEIPQKYVTPLVRQIRWQNYQLKLTVRS